MSNLSGDELRIITAYAPVLLKLLRNREARILSQIYGEFRNGKTEHTAKLAEFCSIRDQINEITNAAKLHEQGED